MSSITLDISSASSSSLRVSSAPSAFETLLAKKVSEIELKKKEINQRNSQSTEVIRVFQDGDVTRLDESTDPKTSISLAGMKFSFNQKLNNCSAQTKINNPNSFEAPLCLFYLYSLFIGPISALETHTSNSSGNNTSSSSSSSQSCSSNKPNDIQNRMLSELKISIRQKKSVLSKIDDINLLIEITKLQLYIFEKDILHQANELNKPINSIIIKNHLILSKSDLKNIKKIIFQKFSKIFFSTDQIIKKIIQEINEPLLNLNRTLKILAKIENDLQDSKTIKGPLRTLKLNFLAKKLELQERITKMLQLVPEKILAAQQKLKRFIEIKIKEETVLQCDACKKPKLFLKTLSRCQRCTIHYCSKECQTKAWPAHRRVCLILKI